MKMRGEPARSGRVDLAADRAVLVGEEGDHRRDLLGRHVRRTRILPGAVRPVGPARHPGEGRGRDEVDLDAVWRARGGQTAGESDHRSLGRRIGEVVGKPEHPARGGHDDAAVALVDHVGPGETGGEERTDHVHREVPVQVLLVGIRRSGPPDDAGVVDHDVDSAEPLDRRTDQRLRAGSGGNVVVVGDRRSAGRDDLLGDVVRDRGVRSRPFRRATEVVDDDPGTAIRQEERIGPTEAATRPGDDGDPPFETERVQAATGDSIPRSRARVPPRIGSRSAAGTSANRVAISSRLPRKVPSACG